MRGCRRESEGITQSLLCGGVVQLVRTPACHAGGRGFESHRFRQIFQRMVQYSSLEQSRAVSYKDRPPRDGLSRMERFATFITLPFSVEPRSRLFGSHPARIQAGTTSVRGCYRSRRLLLPYASRRNAPTRAGSYGPSWLRCTNSASISTQCLPPFV